MIVIVILSTLFQKNQTSAYLWSLWFTITITITKKFKVHWRENFADQRFNQKQSIEKLDSWSLCDRRHKKTRKFVNKVWFAFETTNKWLGFQTAICGWINSKNRLWFTRISGRVSRHTESIQSKWNCGFRLASIEIESVFRFSSGEHCASYSHFSRECVFEWAMPIDIL
jgi:hypothetical protein